MGWKLRGSDSRSRGLSVIFVPTAVPVAFIVEIDRRADDRGFFARTWCRREDGERRRRATLPPDPAALRTLPEWTLTRPVPSRRIIRLLAPRRAGGHDRRAGYASRVRAERRPQVRPWPEDHLVDRPRVAPRTGRACCTPTQFYPPFNALCAIRKSKGRSLAALGMTVLHRLRGRTNCQLLRDQIRNVSPDADRRRRGRRWRIQHVDRA